LTIAPRRRERVLAAQPHGLQVHGEHLVPFGTGHGSGVTVHVAPGVVDERVDPADRSQGVRDLVLARDVGRDEAGAERRRGPLAGVGGQVEERDLRPLAQRDLDDRAADPLRAAGHDHGRAVEPHQSATAPSGSRAAIWRSGS
jgi:hypothetical protein